MKRIFLAALIGTLVLICLRQFGIVTRIPPIDGQIEILSGFVGGS